MTEPFGPTPDDLALAGLRRLADTREDRLDHAAMKSALARRIAAERGEADRWPDAGPRVAPDAGPHVAHASSAPSAPAAVTDFAAARARRRPRVWMFAAAAVAVLAIAGGTLAATGALTPEEHVALPPDRAVGPTTGAQGQTETNEPVILTASYVVNRVHDSLASPDLILKMNQYGDDVWMTTDRKFYRWHQGDWDAQFTIHDDHVDEIVAYGQFKAYYRTVTTPSDPDWDPQQYSYFGALDDVRALIDAIKDPEQAEAMTLTSTTSDDGKTVDHVVIDVAKLKNPAKVLDMETAIAGGADDFWCAPETVEIWVDHETYLPIRVSEKTQNSIGVPNTPENTAECRMYDDSQSTDPLTSEYTWIPRTPEALKEAAELPKDYREITPEEAEELRIQLPYDPPLWPGSD